MEKKFKHISVIQKGNSLHVEANKEEKPNWKNYKLSIDNCIDIEKWESKHQHLPFFSMEDMNKTRLYLSNIKRKQIELNKWHASDCIKIKDGHAYFKEPKVLGIDYEFSIGENGMVEEIPITEESQDSMIDEIIEIGTSCLQGDLMNSEIKRLFTITRNKK